ncbi:MAG: hypothetical protein ACXVXI_02335, partial [Mycobacteriaceae bacterium]
MAALLPSYVNGRWFTASDEGTPLNSAVTGDELARISSTGVDVAALLDYARSVGGPALQELTFHQRASQLKALGKLLMAGREEFYALSTCTGATPAPSTRTLRRSPPRSRSPRLPSDGAGGAAD